HLVKGSPKRSRRVTDSFGKHIGVPLEPSAVRRKRRLLRSKLSEHSRDSRCSAGFPLRLTKSDLVSSAEISRTDRRLPFGDLRRSLRAGATICPHARPHRSRRCSAVPPPSFRWLASDPVLALAC